MKSTHARSCRGTVAREQASQPVRATPPREAEEERWLAENEQAIDQYNAFVEHHGAFGDHLRGF
jgi:post-segregation antitoxin (ccd killing protein)